MVGQQITKKSTFIDRFVGRLLVDFCSTNNQTLSAVAGTQLCCALDKTKKVILRINGNNKNNTTNQKKKIIENLTDSNNHHHQHHQHQNNNNNTKNTILNNTYTCVYFDFNYDGIIYTKIRRTIKPPTIIVYISISMLQTIIRLIFIHIHIFEMISLLFVFT